MRATNELGLGFLTLILVACLAAGAPGQSSKSRTQLIIEGADSRAVVTVDGVRHGRVARIDTLAPGRHTVVVRQLGYVDSTTAVNVSKGAVARVRPKKVPLRDKAELSRQQGDDLAWDGKHADAVGKYTEAIAARPGFLDAKIGLARSQFSLKRLDEALALLGEIIEQHPKSSEAHAVLGNVLRDRGLAEDAVAEYRNAIELARGRSPEAHTGLGIALQEIGDADGSISALEKGIQQNSDAEPILYQLLGNALEHADRRDAAIVAYRRFLELAPNHSLAPAVASVVERLESDSQAPEEGDANPFSGPP